MHERLGWLLLRRATGARMATSRHKVRAAAREGTGGESKLEEEE